MIGSLPGMTPRIHDSAFIAENAAVIGDVDIGAEASVWFGAVIRGDHPDFGIRVGDRSNVQDGAVLHVSAAGATILEDEVTIGHGAVLESCVVGSRCVIGMNAVVLQGARLGPGCLVAAGAVVKAGADVPAGSLVAGVPGRVRALTDRASHWIDGSAEHYVELSRRYLQAWTDRSQGGSHG